MSLPAQGVGGTRHAPPVQVGLHSLSALLAGRRLPAGVVAGVRRLVPSIWRRSQGGVRDAPLQGAGRGQHGHPRRQPLPATRLSAFTGAP
eukprot:9490273-Lingulodinium_polyedra.AAC.1